VSSAIQEYRDYQVTWLRYQENVIFKNCHLPSLVVTMQVHPQHSRKALGITDAMLAKVDDNDTPQVFWQLEVAVKGQVGLLRELSLRVLCGKAAALGCERLWSYARITLTDNRRSMDSQRLMELMQIRMNSHLLDDKETNESQQQILELMQDADGVASIFEDLEAFEEEEIALKRAEAGLQEGATIDEIVDSDAAEDDKEEEVEPLDLFN
jgi:hypothetical protein